MAVDPAGRRAAALLNGRGRAADDRTRVSRGDLALRAAYTGSSPPRPGWATTTPSTSCWPACRGCGC
ncbi:hypothetical protein ACFQ0B_36060 [Nonomuraea thailandensis]